MARRKRRSRTLLGVIDAVMATSAQKFIDGWARLERAYKRPLAWLALRVRFAFYPLLALGAVLWLVYDWNGNRSLAAAENAVFDKVIKSRPIEPAAVEARRRRRDRRLLDRVFPTDAAKAAGRGAGSAMPTCSKRSIAPASRRSDTT